MRARTIGWCLLLTMATFLTGCGSDDDGGVFEILPADLIILAVESPTTATPGQVLQVSVTVRNIGDEATSASAPLSIVLSLDNLAESGDRILLEDLIPVLGGGATIEVTVDVTVPTNVQPGVDYWIGAIVDAANLIAEAAETNNSRVDAEGLEITGSLDLLGASFASPAAACPGQTIDVDTAVDNMSTVEVRDVQVGVYLSADPEITGADTLLATYTIVQISAGGSDGRSVPITIPTGTAPGLWFLGLISDDNGVFTEVDETNNVAFDAGGVQINQEATEPNESIAASAFLGGPGPQTIVFAGYICPAGDLDYFAFDQDEGFGITVDLGNLSQDLDLTLFDVNGTILATSANAGTAPESILFTATYTGTYHVRVQGATGTEEDAANPYDLTITLD